MRCDSLSGRQLACVTALFVIGNSSAVGSSGLAGRDTWAAILLATAAALPLGLLYARVSALYPEKSLFGMIEAAFGRVAGWVITLLVTLWCFCIGAMVLRDFPEFVHATALPRTPLIVFTLIFALVCAYLARLGAASFGMVAVLFSWLVMAAAVVTFLFLLPSMELKHIRPVLTTPLPTIALNAAKLLGTSFGESVMLLCLFCNARPGQKKGRAFVCGLLLGGGYLTLSVVRNILTLGAGNFISVYFPSYSAVSILNIGDFFQRVEALAAGYLLICDVVKIAVAIYAVSLGVQHLFRLRDNKTAVLPAALLMIPVSVFAFGSTMQFYQWNPKYLLFSLPVQLLLPLALWLIGAYRRRQ